MAQATYLPAPREAANESPAALRAHGRQLAEVVNGVLGGKLNAVFAEFTLAANAASSTLTDARLAQQSVVLFDPLTANAAAELAAGTLYVLTANRNAESWTVTHANNAQVDRTYRVLIIG